jgi:ABC-type amino acid transport substrate-binding protein
MGRRQVLAAMTLFGAVAMASRPAGSAQTLKVGAALPDPPFEFTRDGVPSGFDIVLMQTIARKLERDWPVRRPLSPSC